MVVLNDVEFLRLNQFVKPENKVFFFFFIPDVKVLDVDILVGRRFPLAPQQQALLCRGLCGAQREKVRRIRRKKKEESEASVWLRDNPRRRPLD